jgi:hypothetical protein
MITSFCFADVYKYSVKKWFTGINHTFYGLKTHTKFSEEYNEIMTDPGTIYKALDKRIRSSLAYTNWVSRNKGTCCLKCDSHEQLECHHLIDLYHVIIDLWRFYGDQEEVFNHINMYHDQDLLEGVTLCYECHKKRHPGRILTEASFQVNTNTWCVIPRMFKINPNHSRVDYRKGSVSLIAYQTIFGIGWHILNGNVEERMLVFNRRNFAKLIGKIPGTSFYKSFDEAIPQLEEIGIICGYHRKDNQIELHICSDYLEMLEKNPWFIPLHEIYAKSMCVLCLRLWLLMQSGRHYYYIGLEKLVKHLGMATKERFYCISAIKSALKHIPWAKMEVKESLQFTLAGHQPTPIRALRAVLTDAIEQSR